MSVYVCVCVCMCVRMCVCERVRVCVCVLVCVCYLLTHQGDGVVDAAVGDLSSVTHRHTHRRIVPNSPSDSLPGLQNHHLSTNQRTDHKEPRPFINRLFLLTGRTIYNNYFRNINNYFQKYFITFSVST